MLDGTVSKDHDKESYFYSAGKPVHRTSYCAFLDVLGFSRRIQKSYQDGSKDALLESFHEVITESVGRIREEADDYSMLYFKTFSDNVLLAHPKISPDMESEFAFIMWSIKRYQLQMAIKGFFVRGGLSVDLLFMDENCIYGQALLEAYKLEQEVAINPVVVLCDKSMALTRYHLKFYPDDSAPQLRDVLKGPDGRYFLNYLTECIAEGDDQDSLNASLLMAHRIQVEQALKTYEEDPRVLAKFSWLASYHNHFCDAVSQLDGYDPSLKISAPFEHFAFRRITED